MKPYNVTIYWLDREPQKASVRAANEMQAVHEAVRQNAAFKNDLYDHQKTERSVKEIVFS